MDAQAHQPNFQPPNQLGDGPSDVARPHYDRFKRRVKYSDHVRPRSESAVAPGLALAGCKKSVLKPHAVVISGVDDFP